MSKEQDKKTKPINSAVNESGTAFSFMDNADSSGLTNMDDVDESHSLSKLTIKDFAKEIDYKEKIFKRSVCIITFLYIVSVLCLSAVFCKVDFNSISSSHWILFTFVILYTAFPFSLHISVLNKLYSRKYDDISRNDSITSPGKIALDDLIKYILELFGKSKN